jgi:peptidoglycan-associated lipoprotein
MLNLSKFAFLSVLLFASACNNMGKGKKVNHNHGDKNTHRYETGLDSYCYCPAKHGTIGVTHFNFDSSVVLPEAQKLIDESISKCVSERLKENDNIKVLVTGYCDKRGTEEYNLALGSRRANATKSYLVESVKDVDHDLSLDGRFCINSKGKEDLIDHAETEEAHAKNRRTVIEFVEECK